MATAKRTKGKKEAKDIEKTIRMIHRSAKKQGFDIHLAIGTEHQEDIENRLNVAALAILGDAAYSGDITEQAHQLVCTYCINELLAERPISHVGVMINLGAATVLYIAGDEEKQLLFDKLGIFEVTRLKQAAESWLKSYTTEEIHAVTTEGRE